MAIDTVLPESLAELEDCFDEFGCLSEVHLVKVAGVDSCATNRK